MRLKYSMGGTHAWKRWSKKEGESAYIPRKRKRRRWRRRRRGRGGAWKGERGRRRGLVGEAMVPFGPNTRPPSMPPFLLSHCLLFFMPTFLFLAFLSRASSGEGNCFSHATTMWLVQQRREEALLACTETSSKSLKKRKEAESRESRKRRRFFFGLGFGW